MKKEEFLNKTEDVLDMLIHKENEIEDAKEHLFVLATKLSKQKCREYEENILKYMNDNLKIDDKDIMHEVLSSVKKTLLPNFD